MLHGRRAYEQRELERDSGSALRTLIGPDTSAVRNYDGTGDRESEPAAAQRTRAGAVGSVEPVKDAFTLCFRDAWAVVFDGQLEALAAGLGRQPDETAGAGVLDRVSSEISDRLRDPIRVPVERSCRRRRELEPSVGRALETSEEVVSETSRTSKRRFWIDEPRSDVARSSMSSISRFIRTISTWTSWTIRTASSAVSPGGTEARSAR